MAMNDPHVVALEYLIEHGPDVVDWSRAAPLDEEEPSFRVQAENGRVRFELREHYASQEAARSAVETDYIRNWEFVVGLARGPNAFVLRFDRSEIVDRNPPSGPPRLNARASVGGFTASANLAPPTPPALPELPPATIKRTPDVDSMYQRYLGHLEGREPLPGMAYFCLTVLQKMGGGASNAARHFSVSNKVLDRIRRLSAYKGGTGARKEDGREAPYTPEEEHFLRSAIKTLIHRAAEIEVESGPHPGRAKITLADFQ
ncbi:MAG: hypothetical protein OYH76_06465 [Defluviicoccus sp.]|nr:hypothetical protein [Defluviicoccus sp.]MDE0275520.1 hypothetical protein [Defluviicoccus sp.]